MSDRTPDEREQAIAEIARLLPQRTGHLARRLSRHAGGTLHRGMASVLATLADGPQTIGRLAEIEGVAQPTVTRVVERLEGDGLVARTRSAQDGRVVLVSLTAAGADELATLRARYTEVLKERLAGLPDERLQDVREAVDALQLLIDALRDEPDGPLRPGG